MAKFKLFPSILSTNITKALTGAGQREGGGCPFEDGGFEDLLAEVVHESELKKPLVLLDGEPIIDVLTIG